MRWLRLLVDEGHEIGRSVSKPTVRSHVSSSNVSSRQDDMNEEANRAPVAVGFDNSSSSRHLASQRMLAAMFINEIAAERRWVMTGTPTRGTSSAVALDQV